MTTAGRVVGSIWWRPTGKHTVELELLDIDDAYQRQGLGETLLREFVRILPSLYPNARYISGNATSQGVIRLLRKVFGRERAAPNLEKLPKSSPDDWLTTRNRSHFYFRFTNTQGVRGPDIAREARLGGALGTRLSALRNRFSSHLVRFDRSPMFTFFF